MLKNVLKVHPGIWPRSTGWGEEAIPTGTDQKFKTSAGLVKRPKHVPAKSLKTKRCLPFLKAASARSETPASLVALIVE